MGETFRRKEIFFADGYKTNTLVEMTYLSVVSRDSVTIALPIAALNDLEVLSFDIQNAYLEADCRKQVWVVAGPEFGFEAGNNMLVRKVLYG